MATNLLNYVDYDYDALVTQLAQRLQQDPTGAWTDVEEDGTGEMLIELFSFVGNMVLYYIERRAEESYLPTAQLRSSVLNLVSLLGYIPRRAVSASGTLTFTLSAPLAVKVFIPQWTIVQTVGGIQFVVVADAVILAGQTSVLVNVKQGTKTEINTTADGNPSYSFNIKDVLVENTSLRVFVGGVEWLPVTSFLTLGASDQVYKLVQEFDDTITIQFGDGVRGAIPPVGATVYIQYVQTAGLSGNVYASAQATTLVSKIYDENGLTVTTLTVTNTQALLGGADEEETEAIRTNAPARFATGDRQVNKNDFEAILLDIASVASVRVWGEAEENPPNYNMFNTVRISTLLQNWAFPSNTFKTALGVTLQGTALQTVKYEFVDPTIVQVIPVLDCKVWQGNTLSQTQSDILSTIGADFTLGQTTKIGQSKYLSNLSAKVQALPAIAFQHMYFDLYQQIIYGYESTYQFGTILSCKPVKRGSFKLYVGSKLVAVDDGYEHLISQDSLYSFSGTSGLDYTTGHVGITFVTPSPHPPSDQVVCRYQQDYADQEGDIILTVDQILQLRQVDITSIAYQS